jgi:hypothetical protein
LKLYFNPTEIEEGYSLSISSGQSGARLSHTHTRQYNYVLQSLALWKEIADNMFKLWWLADEDLLSENSPYRVEDTGQGLNRIQNSPRVAKAMQRILTNTQRHLQGDWIGSSVVHLGDTNVPNALMFIDKYGQVARILNPIVTTLERIEAIYSSDDKIGEYIDLKFSGVENLRKIILADFFRYAFDGSGADNFFDAGSCIDGRLTSAWNWCSQLPSKPFFSIFKLAGFIGFDGSFQK